MAPSISISILVTLFIASFFHFSLISNANDELLTEACINGMEVWDYKLCLQVLQNDFRISSASDVFTLATSIIESGIFNATNTRAFIQKSIENELRDAAYYGSLEDCNDVYNSIIGSFQSALVEVKDHKEYNAATYDLLLLSTDYVNSCQNALDSQEMQNSTISAENKFVKIFGLAALKIVSRLDQNSAPPRMFD
ncbi:Uncharacterized protein Adt_19342 [Abeliophyllum distichum]|uniref:Pectinesterase inhibitor domain-containing protein n=1 Tax=Abeliophyllum distichum TaxID=126358 RepID=A0ABD1SSP3_9LAMI